MRYVGCFLSLLLALILFVLVSNVWVALHKLVYGLAMLVLMAG